MRIIDDKGRLFGKINIIDFLVIFFLFCLIPIFYFGYKVITKKPVVVRETIPFADLEISCEFIKVDPEILKRIAVGDKEIDANGVVIGEIAWIGESKPYYHRFNLGSGETITKEDPILKEIFVKLRLRVDIKDNNLYYKNNLISVNSSFDFKTDKYILQAIPIIERVEKVEKIKKPFTDNLEIDCKLIKVDPEVIKDIAVGDKETDEENKIIGEIIYLGKIRPYKYEFYWGSGETITKEDPILKEIFVKLRLRVDIKDNNLYYKNNLISVNSSFDFKTDKYILQTIPIIEKIIEKKQLNEKWVQIQVKFSELIPELAKLVNKGDTEKNLEGNISARLERIVSNKPSQVLVIEKDKWVTLNHPFNREIVVIISILCAEKDGMWYFKNYPVKIGNAITFSSGLYSISGTIISLEIK